MSETHYLVDKKALLTLTTAVIWATNQAQSIAGAAEWAESILAVVEARLNGRPQ